MISNFILREETKRQYGYDPIDLRPMSRKKVLVECPGCGDIRDVAWANHNRYGSIKCVPCASNKYKSKHDKHEAVKLQKRISQRIRYILGISDTERIVKRIRSSMFRALKKYKTDDMSLTVSSLNYSKQNLVDHIHGLIDQYSNRCPACDMVLTAYHIDHKIPLASAKKVSDIVELFTLSNLDILCPSGNASKGKKINWSYGAASL